MPPHYFSILPGEIQPFVKPLLTLLLLLFVANLQAQNTGCADTSYRMRFSSPGKDFTFYTHCSTTDGGTVLAGRIINIADSSNEFAIIKLDAAGNIVWRSFLPYQKRIFISRILEQTNKEIALLGYFANISSLPEMAILKFSPSGTFLWCRTYLLDSRYTNDFDRHPYFLTEGFNNDLLFTFKGMHYANSNSSLDDDSSYVIITRVTNTGTIVWSKAFAPHINNFQTNPSGVFIYNGKIYSFGYADDMNSGCFNEMGSLYAMCLDYNTGNLLQMKTFCHSEPQSTSSWGFFSPERSHYNAVKLLNNQFALFGRFSAFDHNNYAYKILLNDQLDIVQATEYQVLASLSIGSVGINVLPDGATHINVYSIFTGKLYWATLNSTNGIVRQRKIDLQNSGSIYGSMNFGYRNSDVYNFCTNFRAGSTRYGLFTQVQRNDPTLDLCLGTDTAFVRSIPIDFTPSLWTWKYITDNPVLSATVSLTQVDFTLQTENLCTQISRCDSLRIAGPDTVCVTSGFVTFTGTKNPDCRKRVLWEMNHLLVDSSYQPNDSVISIRFKPVQGDAPQTMQLFASAANCTIAKDTTTVVLLPGLKPLPPDTIVCGPVNIRLTPGKWGRSYRWQNGTTDSVFVTADSGTYSVQVTTVCGDVFRDTIRIAKAAVALGPDKTVCRGDTITLKATPGFRIYQWSVPGSFQQLTDSVIRLSAIANMRCIVAAQAPSGCWVSDTLLITVLQPPVVNLGNDISFCSGDSVLLQPTGSFNHYQWNTGSASASIHVATAGKYWLRVWDNNGCSAADTINVLPPHPTPVVSVLPKGIACIGQSDTLRATPGFSNYQWRTGETGSHLFVSDTGTYWVTVMDNNGCYGSDTAVITKLTNPPNHFLPTDTTICAGWDAAFGPLNNFDRYRWSTGAATATTSVSTAGLYILEVRDRNGCTGKDTAVVTLKNCPNKIWFPTAFTPNDDGRNDVLKPIVEGRLLNYSFMVYNRWGGVVFATTDYRKAWGGDVKDVVQGNTAFVWLCRYRFSGEEEKLAKGTVVLVR